MPSSGEKKKESRIEWLDSLRGIASLSVVALHYYHRVLLALIPTVAGGTLAAQAELEKKVLSHTIDFYKETPFFDIIGNITPFIYGFWDLGKIGVIAFFFISGYVIAYTLNRLKESPVKTFVIGRFFRLYPIFWVSLILMISLRFLSGHAYHWTNILSNLTMFNKFLFIPDINGVAWTLQIELTFYILAVLFLVQGFAKSHKHILATVYAFLVLAFGMSVIKNQTGVDLPLAFPLGLSIMFMGWFWRLSHENSQIPQKRVAWVALSFLPIWWVTFQLGYTPHAGTYFNSYVAGMILVAVFALVKVQHPILRFFGNISYSLYLIHDVIGLHVFPWLMSLSLPFYHDHFFATIFPIAGVAGFSIALATLLYYGIEKPGVLAGKRVLQALSPQKVDNPKYQPIKP